MSIKFGSILFVILALFVAKLSFENININESQNRKISSVNSDSSN